MLQENTLKKAPHLKKNTHRLANIVWRFLFSKRKILQSLMPNKHPAFSLVCLHQCHHMMDAKEEFGVQKTNVHLHRYMQLHCSGQQTSGCLSSTMCKPTCRHYVLVKILANPSCIQCVIQVEVIVILSCVIHVTFNLMLNSNFLRVNGWQNPVYF